MTKKLSRKNFNSTLNLRTSVQLSQFALSVPDFFWSAADALQALYNRVRQYLEIDERAEVLSTRFDTLQGVLELARQTQDARHTARLGKSLFVCFSLLVFFSSFRHGFLLLIKTLEFLEKKKKKRKMQSQNTRSSSLSL